MSTIETNVVSLRNLDDIACANVIVSRQIRKLVRKFPSLRNIDLDCSVHGCNYTSFEINKDNKFVWHGSVYDRNGGKSTIFADDEDLYYDELNKLLVFTYRAMCESQDSLDLIDTAEDLLSFAETKLKEMLHDSNMNANA